MVVTRPLQYPDLADPHRWLRVFPTEISDEQRLPAYSGATVPDLNRLPVADVLIELATPVTSPLGGRGCPTGVVGVEKSAFRAIRRRVQPTDWCLQKG